MDHEPKRSFYRDTSLWILLGSNVLTIGIALTQEWSLLTIMVAYWLQSVIIGGFNVIRILSLKNFSTENFYINNTLAAPTEKTKKSIARFFALHYGFFHLIYLVFLITSESAIDWNHVLIAGGIFLFDHAFSFKYNKERDEKRITNIGRLMFFPYARIIPMHIVLLMYGFVIGEGALIIFLGLKTLADVLMHVVEHQA
jgi:hypothetical protein